MKNKNKDNISYINLIRGLWKHTKSKRKMQLVFVSFLMIFGALLETITLASLLPFLSALTNPSRFFEELKFTSYFSSINSLTTGQFLLVITLCFSLIVILSSIIRIFNIWYSGIYSANIGSDLSIACFKSTIYQNYDVHLNQSTSKLLNIITKEVGSTTKIIEVFLNLLTAFLILLSLTISLFILSWKIAIFGGLVLFCSYFLIVYFSKKKLLKNSKKASLASSIQIKLIQESLGSIKEIILNRAYEEFVNIYEKNDRPLRKIIAQNQFLTIFPRYGMEGLSLTLIAFISFSIVVGKENGYEVLPLLGAISLGALRLLPNFQLIYASWATIQANKTPVMNVMNCLSQDLNHEYSDFNNLEINFKKEIIFKNLFFKYNKNSKKSNLENINLTIKKGDKIGIIGSTGSGKSTFIDILMGLLKPTSGHLLIDGIDINKKNNFFDLISWRSSIAHVPQNIFLVDAPIDENIAFVSSQKKINMAKVYEVAKKAQIFELLKSENTSKSSIGERGLRISGGQVQRIAIARALYQDKKVLVLDEATSSLDSKTENLIMKSLLNLEEDLTLIMIAHRLSSLKGCNKVIEFKEGTIHRIYNEDEWKLRNQ